MSQTLKDNGVKILRQWGYSRNLKQYDSQKIEAIGNWGVYLKELGFKPGNIIEFSKWQIDNFTILEQELTKLGIPKETFTEFNGDKIEALGRNGKELTKLGCTADQLVHFDLNKIEALCRNGKALTQSGYTIEELCLLDSTEIEDLYFSKAHQNALGLKAEQLAGLNHSQIAILAQYVPKLTKLGFTTDQLIGLKGTKLQNLQKYAEKLTKLGFTTDQLIELGWFEIGLLWEYAEKLIGLGLSIDQAIVFDFNKFDALEQIDCLWSITEKLLALGYNSDQIKGFTDDLMTLEDLSLHGAKLKTLGYSLDQLAKFSGEKIKTLAYELYDILPPGFLEDELHSYVPIIHSVLARREGPTGFNLPQEIWENANTDIDSLAVDILKNQNIPHEYTIKFLNAFHSINWAEVVSKTLENPENKIPLLDFMKLINKQASLEFVNILASKAKSLDQLGALLQVAKSRFGTENENHTIAADVLTCMKGFLASSTHHYQDQDTNTALKLLLDKAPTMKAVMVMLELFAKVSHNISFDQFAIASIFEKSRHQDVSVNDIVRVLAGLSNIDWMQVLDSALANKPLEQIDPNSFFRFVDQRTEPALVSKLMEKLVKQITSRDQLQDLLSICNDKFNVGVTAEILDNIAPNLLDLRIFLSLNDSATQKMELSQLVYKILEKCTLELTPDNIDLLRIIDFDWNARVDADGSTFPIQLMKSNPTEDSIQKIMMLVSVENGDHLPLCNVNLKDSANQRLIDKVEAVFSNGEAGLKRLMKQFIDLLRHIGSEEPINPIQNPAKLTIGMLDISNDHLDGYEPNVRNIAPLLEAAYKRFPLTKDEIDREIAMFKAEHAKASPTIPDIIDDLANPGRNFSEIYQEIRYFGQGQVIVAWNPKKAIATMIHIVRSSNDKDFEIFFIEYLLQLTACNLGKLINYVEAVQNHIVGNNSDQIKYGEKSLMDFASVILEVKAKLDESLNAAEILTKWYNDIRGNKTPEDWCAATLKVQGLLNAAFAQTIPAASRMESYHYVDGLKGKLTVGIVESLLSGRQFASSLFDMFKAGKAIVVESFFRDFIIHDYTDKEMKDILTKIMYNEKALYGDFDEVRAEFFIYCYGEMQQKSPQQARLFIQLIKDQAMAISANAEAAIDAILATAPAGDDPLNHAMHLGGQGAEFDGDNAA